MYHVVIPARLGSTRLPAKALADIHGYPMVYWVWRRAQESNATSVVIATDHDAIASAMAEHGAEVAMTRKDHPSGTDRIAEVIDQRKWDDDSVIVNLQGDEPLMPAANLNQVAGELVAHPDAGIATLAAPIDSLEAFNDPAVVKVVSDADGRALYFSRSPMPHPRGGQASNRELLLAAARRHVGLYAYRCGLLRQFVTWPPSPAEGLESLEQLRALHQGACIRVVDACKPVPAGVDTASDLERVRDLIGATP